MPAFMHQRLGYDGFIIGLVLGAYALTTLLTRPLSGRIGDRAGVRVAVLLGDLAGSEPGPAGRDQQVRAPHLARTVGATLSGAIAMRVASSAS